MNEIRLRLVYGDGRLPDYEKRLNDEIKASGKPWTLIGATQHYNQASLLVFSVPSEEDPT